MNMHVFMNGSLIVIESNIAYAVPYWEKRKSIRRSDNIHITWKFV